MKLHKTILAIMTSTIILGIGADIEQTNVCARHVRIHKVQRNKRNNRLTFKNSKKNLRKNRKTNVKHKNSKKTTKQNIKKNSYKRKRATKRIRKSRKHDKVTHSQSLHNRRIRKRAKRVIKARKQKSHITRIQMGIDKLYQYFINQGNDPEDARMQAKSFMDGSSQNSLGNPTITKILTEYEPIDGYQDYQKIANGAKLYKIGVNKVYNLYRKWGFNRKLAKYFALDDIDNSDGTFGYDATSTDGGQTDNKYRDAAISRIKAKYTQYDPKSLVPYAENNNLIPRLAPQTKYAKIVEERELHDINVDRASMGEAPDVIDPELQTLAEMRAPQLIINFDHYEPDNVDNGNTYTSEDDPNVSVDENICQTIGDSAKISADNANVMMFYNEQPNTQNPDGGGHYYTILHNNGKVGIGYYDGNIAEDFGAD